ncbi:hypothetical protein Scep_013253 [Stephania cephalantha]|uniref:Uncharacterized protein n=1 Tax=Stephania cephalantha TaxID=152367 RepID=A0AAP0JIT6_9MAGN
MKKNNNNNNKNTNNRSIFLCFRPVVVEEKSLNHHDHLHKVLAYIKIGEQQQQQQQEEEVCCDQELEMEIPPMVDDRDKMSPKSTKPKKMKAWLLKGGCRRRSAHRIISKIAKAMLFDSKLTKRIRSRKVRQDPNRQIEETDEERIDSSSQSTFSRSSSSLTTLTTSPSLNRSSSSCLSSSTTSNSFRSSEPNQTVDSRRSRSTRISRSNNYSGWYLIVVSLVSVILFGRFLAILWTATWLFLVPSRRASSSCGNEDNRRVAAKISNADCRLSLSRDRANSRVVMEGFLERNSNSRSVS